MISLIIDTDPRDNRPRVYKKNLNRVRIQDTKEDENDDNREYASLLEVNVENVKIYQSPIFGYSEGERKKLAITYEYKKFVKRQILRSSRSTSPALEKK